LDFLIFCFSILQKRFFFAFDRAARHGAHYVRIPTIDEVCGLLQMVALMSAAGESRHTGAEQQVCF
jgi:hypothetical protein